MATHSSILPGESHGQRSLADYSAWGHKESDTAEHTSRTLYQSVSCFFFGRVMQHVGSYFPDRDQTLVPCIGGAAC